MKKVVLSFIIVVSLLSVLVMNVSAAAPRSATLASIEYRPSKGVVLTFHTTGTFYQADFLNAYINVNHQNYSMHCVSPSDKDNHVICEASGQVVKFHGYSAYGSMGGFSFSTTIPKHTHIHESELDK